MDERRAAVQDRLAQALHKSQGGGIPPGQGRDQLRRRAPFPGPLQELQEGCAKGGEASLGTHDQPRPASTLPREGLEAPEGLKQDATGIHPVLAHVPQADEPALQLRQGGAARGVLQHTGPKPPVRPGAGKARPRAPGPGQARKTVHGSRRDEVRDGAVRHQPPQGRARVTVQDRQGPARQDGASRNSFPGRGGGQGISHRWQQRVGHQHRRPPCGQALQNRFDRLPNAGAPVHRDERQAAGPSAVTGHTGRTGRAGCRGCPGCSGCAGCVGCGGQAPPALRPPGRRARHFSREKAQQVRRGIPGIGILQ